MSEEIGKKLAGMYGKSSSPLAAAQTANTQRAELNALIQSSLKDSILAAVNGYNGAPQSTIKLSTADGGGRMMFNFGSVLTLTVIFRDQELDLTPRIKSANNVAQKVQVINGNDAFQYQFRNPNPTVSAPLLSQDEFVECILKMALDQSL